MSCCFCISDEPTTDPSGRLRTFETGRNFQTTMMESPCAGGIYTFAWFLGQMCPFSCCITQFLLRRKVLQNDMSKYSCCQGYANVCCFKSGSLGEASCPTFCLCLESFFCNGFAVSASRMYVMDKYQLSSDPCDYRLIRLNNCIQLLACVCDILAQFDRNLNRLAVILDHVADILFHLVSSCMTAQTAHEVDYQIKRVAALRGGVTGLGDESYPLKDYSHVPVAEPVKTVYHQGGEINNDYPKRY